MSYTLVQKTLSGTDTYTLATAVAEYIAEQVPALSIMYSVTSSSSSTERTYYLSFNGTASGIYIKGYYYNSYGSVSRYVYMGRSYNISDSTGNTAGSTDCGYSTDTTNSTTSYKVTVAIVTTDSGYIIRVGNAVMYIGYLTSALAGKKIAILSLNSVYSYSPFNSFSVSSNSSSALCSEDGSTYNLVAALVMVPATTNAPTGSAVLVPVQIVPQSMWCEPLFIPNVYRMQATSYPNLLVDTTVGDTTVVYVGGSSIVVA